MQRATGEPVTELGRQRWTKDIAALRLPPGARFLAILVASTLLAACHPEPESPPRAPPSLPSPTPGPSHKPTHPPGPQAAPAATRTARAAGEPLCRGVHT
jgi:hypothetical protein